MGAASAPLAATAENVAGWGSVHLDLNEPGSYELLGKIDEYASAFMSSANVDHVESHLPIYDAARNEMLVHVESKALTMTIMKVLATLAYDPGLEIAQKKFR